MKKVILLVGSLATCSSLVFAGNQPTDLGANLHSERTFTPIHHVQPKFPNRLARLGQEGYAVVEFDIDANGNVENASVVETKGGVEFGNASLKAVKNWRFEPELVDGTTQVASAVRIQLDFVLSEEGINQTIKDENFHKTTFNVSNKK